MTDLRAVHFLRGRGGWRDFFLGGGEMQKNGFRRGASQKLRGKKGGKVKYFIKNFKWHNVLILKML